MLVLVSGLAAKQQLHEELVPLVESPFWRGTSEGGNAGEVAESTAAWSGVRKCIVLSCISSCLGLKLISKIIPVLLKTGSVIIPSVTSDCVCASRKSCKVS